MAIYEFETGTLSGATIGTDGARSFVENMTFVGAYVELSIPSLTEGWYDLDISYAQGFGDSLSPYRLTIDNGNSYILYFQNTTDWGTFESQSFPKIFLSAGTNILRFTQYGAPANLDFFNLVYSSNQINSMPDRLKYLDSASGLDIITTPARQNIYLADGSFTSNNYDLSQLDSNKSLICENTTAGTITLTDINWETIEKFAEIEVFRTNAAIQIVVGTGLTSIGSSVFNIKSEGFAYLKHLKDKIWFIQGDLE